MANYYSLSKTFISPLSLDSHVFLSTSSVLYEFKTLILNMNELAMSNN